MENKAIRTILIIIGLSCLAYICVTGPGLLKSISEHQHFMLKQKNDSIHMVIEGLRQEAKHLSDSLSIIVSLLDRSKSESILIKNRYQQQVSEIKQKPPQQIRHDFDSIYPTDGISPEHTIRTDQAMQAVVTHVEKNQAEALLDNALHQVTLLESINTIQAAAIVIRDQQIDLLELRNENTEKYYQARLEEKESELSRLKWQRWVERGLFVAVLAVGIVL